MKNKVFYISSLIGCMLICGCSSRDKNLSIDVNTEGFYNTINETKSSIEYAKKYENYILEMYLDNNVAELEASFLGVFDEGDSESKTQRGETEPKALGEYSGLDDYLIYSRAEASRFYKSVEFDSGYIDEYSNEDIEKYTEIAKSLCDIDIHYYILSKNEECFTQVFNIEDIKSKEHYIYMKWRGNKCEEIKCDYYEYLW